MQLVVAVDGAWGIGKSGVLLAHVRADMKNFRALTAGKTVILGSKTLATFPGGNPLPKRRNIILSRRAGFTVPGAEVVHSVPELVDVLGDGVGDAIVIGGASVYAELLPYCTEAFVTRFDRTFVSDAFFPDLDADADWERVETGEWLDADPETDTPADVHYRFETYRRKSGTP